MCATPCSSPSSQTNGKTVPDLTKLVFDIGTWLIPLTIAIVFHEVAHGRTAKHFGDTTAADMGRLSLNPIRHVDPIGTVILPMVLAVTGAPIFGWAKPVPVVQSRLRNPRWHMVLVAAAGPLSNIFLAIVASIAFGLILKSTGGLGDGMAPAFIAANFQNFIAINLFLAVFNMIPLPPFDGSKVFAGFLPDGLRQRFQGLDRYAFLFILFLMFVVPQIAPQANIIGRIVLPPVQWLLERMSQIISLFV
jgi:Zn-dependent protease